MGSALPSSTIGVESRTHYSLFLHRNDDHHFRSVLETHKGIFREHVHMKLRRARCIRYIDGIGNHRGDARHAAGRSGDFHFRRVHVVLRDGIAVMPLAEEADMNRHRVHPPRLEIKAHSGGDGAHQAHTAHDLDVTIANAEGMLPAGRARHIDHYRGMIRLSHAAQGAGRAAQFELDGTRRRFGADLQSLGQILVLQADVGHGGEFGLGGDQRPDHHGDRQGEQLPAEILKQQIADPLERADHGCARSAGGLRLASVVSGISPAKSSICGAGGCCTPKCRLMRSTTSVTESPGDNSPNAATEIRPVSSETTSERQSVSSVIPMAARCRVPNWRASAGLVVSGRKHAAAEMRSLWIITAPSCSGSPGWKMESRISREMRDSRGTPLSTNVRSPMSRSSTTSAPIFSWEKCSAAIMISLSASGARKPLAKPNQFLRPMRARVRRISDWKSTMMASPI